MVILCVVWADYPDRGCPVGFPGRSSETENSMVETETGSETGTETGTETETETERSMAATCVVSGLSGALFISYAAQISLYIMCS